MTVLFIATEYPVLSGGGGFTETVRRTLSEIPNCRVITRLIGPGLSFSGRLANALRGYVYGVTPKIEDELVEICKKEHVDVLFAGYTYFGRLCRNVKRRCPGVRIVSLASNVEVLYSWEMFRVLRSRVVPWAVLHALIYLNERWQLSVGDYFLGLNKRDAECFSRIYGRAPDDLVGMVLPDSYRSDVAEDGEYALFVGSRFPPNEFAVRWIARHLAPKSPVAIKIVGRGFEDMRDEFQDVPNLEIVGTVDDLASYYNGARFVLSPIFHGSGMKVKTAEALMFGKRILGSREALEGYSVEGMPNVIQCQDEEDFLSAMRDSTDCQKFCPENRDLYQARHSVGTLRSKLELALGIGTAG